MGLGRGEERKSSEIGISWYDFLEIRHPVRMKNFKNKF
jgi:hypothetical protein